MSDAVGSIPASLLEAMLAVQGELPTMPKDRTVKVKTRTGGEYSYSYTPLDTIVEKVGPLLTKNGLVWTTKPSWHESLGPTLKYKLAHAPSKEFEEGEMPLMLAEKDAQGMGSAITYMRRYALCAVLNIVADMDDDGQRSVAGHSPQQDAGLASPQAKKFLRTLITQNRMDELTVRRLFESVEYAVPADVKVNDAINGLSREQCSRLIDFIKDGAVPTGESDVPNENPPAHEPTADDQFAPPELGDVFHHEDGSTR